MYFPKCHKTSYMCDVIVDCFVDVLDGNAGVCLPVATQKNGQPDDGDVQKIKDLWKKASVPLLKLLTKNMKCHGGKYAAGDRLTIADCAMVACLVNIWQNKSGPMYATYEQLYQDEVELDKGCINDYFDTLRAEFKERLDSSERGSSFG